MPLQPEAIARFVDRQKRLLRSTYDDAWYQGVASYTPDDEPSREPTLHRDMATAGLVGAALLIARRSYRYQAPVHPDAMRRAIALAPAYRGLNHMALELSNLAAGSAPEVLDGGGVEQALPDWIASNAYRLDAGDSVSWAGEQAGYAEAADADGQFLYAWMSVGDTRVCSDCELLSGFPPMALGEWPSSPGAGDTECSVGCRCTWDTWPVPLPADYVPTLSAEQKDLSSVLADRQLQALSDMMAEAQYLG